MPTLVTIIIGVWVAVAVHVVDDEVEVVVGRAVVVVIGCVGGCVGPVDPEDPRNALSRKCKKKTINLIPINQSSVVKVLMKKHRNYVMDRMRLTNCSLSQCQWIT